MKLTTIEQTRKRSDSPLIHFGKNGQFFFNKASILEFSLEEGDKVDFLQDMENPKDFYLRPTGNELKIRKGSQYGGITGSSSTVMHAIEEAHGIKAPFWMRIATHPTDGCYYALLPERGRDE